MVDKTIQEQRKEKLINLLIQLGRINIDRDKLVDLLYNESFNENYCKKLKTYTFWDSLNSGVTLDESFEASQFENMSMYATRLIAMANIDDPKKYQTREIKDEEILDYYRGDPDALVKAKAKMNNFADKFVKVFNDNELSIQEIEAYLNLKYFNGFYQNAEENPDFVAEIFSEMKHDAIRRRYVENMLDSISNSKIASEIRLAYANIDKKDFRKMFFVNDVRSHLGHKAVDDIIRKIKLLQNGYEEYVENELESVIHKVLVTKFMSIHDKDFAKNIYDNCQMNEDEWNYKLKHLGLEENFDQLLDFMYECYEKHRIDAYINDEFVEYFKKNELDDLRCMHIFRPMYGILELGNDSFDNFDTLLFNMSNPLERFDKKKDIDKIINNTEKPDPQKYLYSKSSAKLEEYLEYEYWRNIIEAEEPEFSSSYWSGNMLEAKIMDMYAEDPDRIDNEVLEYFRSRIADHTGHNMARGVLSPDFMQEHGYDLIKIVVNSDYDKKTAMRIIDDIITKDRVTEPNM